MTTEEIKQQAHKEFNEVCKTVNVAELLDQDFDLKFKSFIDSIIDKTVQIAEEREKTLKQIHKMEIQAIALKSLEEFVIWKDFITNKSDINK